MSTIGPITQDEILRPLTDAELSAHVWPAGTLGIDDLAAQIAAGGQAA